MATSALQTTPRQPATVPEARGPLGEPWHAWTALFIGVLAVSAHAASSLVYSVLMKPMLAEFGGDRADFASAMSLRMLVMVLTISFAGQLTDRFGARLVLATGALVIGLGNLTAAVMTSMGQFYPIMAFMGPGQAAIGSVAASALVLRLFHHRRGLAIGVLNGGDNLINSGVSVGAAVLLTSSGWRFTVRTMGRPTWRLRYSSSGSCGREKAPVAGLRGITPAPRRLDAFTTGRLTAAGLGHVSVCAIFPGATRVCGSSSFPTPVSMRSSPPCSFTSTLFRRIWEEHPRRQRIC